MQPYLQPVQPRRLGEILVARAGVRPEDVSRALQKQREEGGLIGEVMLRMKLIDEDQLALALAEQAEMPWIKDLPKAESIPAELIDGLPINFAKHHKVCPLGRTETGRPATAEVGRIPMQATPIGESRGTVEAGRTATARPVEEAGRSMATPRTPNGDPRRAGPQYRRPANEEDGRLSVERETHRNGCSGLGWLWALPLAALAGLGWYLLRDSPTERGVSRSRMNNTSPAMVQRIAGPKNTQRQPRYTATTGQMPAAAHAPIEWEVFQIDILVASVSGGNQCVISRQHGGKPMPCTQPLIIQATPSSRTAELKPKKTLAPTESISPMTMK